MHAVWFRSWSPWLLLAALLCLAPVSAAAQTFSSGSTGADGPFNPPGSVPPGTTVSGSTYTVPLPPAGIYHFTTLTVASGLTVKFARNAANTPVVLLASGNVTIAGTIDVSGAAGQTFGRPGRGGPGGFDGGAGADAPRTSAGGVGLGPGGGGVASLCPGANGGYGAPGSNAPCNGSLYYNCTGSATGGPWYGSPLLRPLIGGSGGGGGYSDAGYGGGGGGGGGALLLASSGTITLTGGWLLADAGSGGGGRNSGGTGSGGALRLVATTITGSGAYLHAGGGTYGSGDGRIRLEAYTLTLAMTGGTSPSPTNGYPQPVFPGTGQPSLTLASVGGIAAPTAPKGSYLDPPDVVLPTVATNPVEVALTASNIPLGTVIQVTVTPQSGNRTTVNSSGLSGSLASSAATASITLNFSQTSILTATATYALVASAGQGPLYADGEEVTHVRVAAVFGGASTITYLTTSGREVQGP